MQAIEPPILELVCNEVVESGGTVTWDDIAGQEQAKRLVQELVVWPMRNPDLFKVRLKTQPWSSAVVAFDLLLTVVVSASVSR